MPLVLIDPLIDVPGGTASTKVYVSAQVYRNEKPAIRLDSDDVVIPDRIETELKGPGQINLGAIPVDCYWRIGLRTRTDYLRRNVVLPTGAGPFQFFQLIDVDEDTNLPDPGSEDENVLIQSITAARAVADEALALAQELEDNIDGQVTTIQIRRNLAATWTSTNPVLAAGEFGYESDNKKLKVGDGTTHWAQLAYLSTGTGQSNLDPEDVMDIVGGFITGSSLIDVEYNDTANSLTIDASAALESALKAGPQIIQWNGTTWVPTPPTDPTVVRYYDSTGYQTGVTVPTAYNQADKWFQYPGLYPQNPNMGQLGSP